MEWTNQDQATVLLLHACAHEHAPPPAVPRHRLHHPGRRLATRDPASAVGGGGGHTRQDLVGVEPHAPVQVPEEDHLHLLIDVSGQVVGQVKNQNKHARKRIINQSLFGTALPWWNCRWVSHCSCSAPPIRSARSMAATCWSRLSRGDGPG